MAPTRASTPPPPVSTREFGHPTPRPPPSTPGPGNGRLDGGNLIIGSQHATVPPSPGGISSPSFGLLTMGTNQDPPVPNRIRKAKGKQGARTGAGVKKAPRTKKQTGGALAKLVAATSAKKPLEMSFRFMDLPGEIRNMVYHHTYDNPKQALLVHCPRMASLRARTRLDRARPLASDITGIEHDTALSDPKSPRRTLLSRLKTGPLPRETNHPFFGLTQVCQLIRDEYRPIYLQKQEIGMDLTEVVDYLQTFYYDAPSLFAELQAPGERKDDLPFTGNLTIAVGDKMNEKELSTEGIEIGPLLDIWANSFKIEAGFGRYMKARYVPEGDGEAKDLYRLFGRRVLPNRSCSQMNTLWRTILRTRALASVRIHRKPASFVGSATSTSTSSVLPVAPPRNVPQVVKPYIHIIFKPEHAEPWMTKFESDIPKSPNWLADRGFRGMEYFDVRVGVALLGK